MGSDILEKLKRILNIDNRKRRAEQSFPVDEPDRFAKHARYSSTADSYLPSSKSSLFQDNGRHKRFGMFNRMNSKHANGGATMGLSMSKSNNKPPPPPLNSINKMFRPTIHPLNDAEFSDDDGDFIILPNKIKPISTSSPKEMIDQFNYNQKQHLQQQQQQPIKSVRKMPDMNPMSLFKQKFSRVPDLRPIPSKLSNNSTASSSFLFTNGSTANNWSNAHAVNGQYAPPPMNKFGPTTNSLSLRKSCTNNVITKPNPPVNSLGDKQSCAIDKHSYINLIRSLVPGFSPSQTLPDIQTNKTTDTNKVTRSPNFQRRQFNKVTADDSINISDDEDTSPQTASPRPMRTEAEIFSNLRNSLNSSTDNIDKICETPKIEPVNSMRKKLESKPVFQEKWMSTLNNRYAGMQLQHKQSIDEELQKAQTIHAETKIREKTYNSNLVKHWLVPESIVLDDEEPAEEVDDFPEFTDSQVKIIFSAMRGPPSSIVNSKFNLNISRHHVQSLDWDHLKWLNDEVINFYMNLLMERSELNEGYPKVHAMNTFFIPRLMEGGYDAVRRWTRRVDIFTADIIPVPVHVGGVHWCMAIIHLKNKTIKYYDSMGSPNRPVLDALESYIKKESLDKKKKELDMTGWTIESVSDCPRQANGSDCGVFSCMFAEFICRDRPITFTQAHMVYFRKRILLEICTGKMII